jgi:hypothetical protein
VKLHVCERQTISWSVERLIETEQFSALSSCRGHLNSTFLVEFFQNYQSPLNGLKGVICTRTYIYCVFVSCASWMQQIIFCSRSNLWISLHLDYLSLRLTILSVNTVIINLARRISILDLDRMLVIQSRKCRQIKLEIILIFLSSFTQVYLGL